MKTNQLFHHLAEEDYAYLSGFLKARESRFLSVSDFITISRFMELQEFIDFLPQHQYKINSNYTDPVHFEESLWKSFYNELNDIARVEPEPFLLPFINAFQKLLFWKSSNEVFISFRELSNNGTELTKNIAHSLIDRYNFFEKIRSLNDASLDWDFETGGKVTKQSINQLFDSHFHDIEIGDVYLNWKPFVIQESSVKTFDFNFTNRLDTFWKALLDSYIKTTTYQTYGLDYCISYFVRWALEIEAIMKVYFTLRFGLHFDLREELYLNAR